MKNSCISYPERDPLVIIRKSQVEFCNGNVCAAALMSFFEYWHNIKLDMAPKNAAMNKIAALHGDEGCQDETLYQFHTMPDLSEGIMGLYGKAAIKLARQQLLDTGLITEHRNPSDRYKFDHTIYYLFHPEIFCKWLNDRYAENGVSTRQKRPMETTKTANGNDENGATITETSLEITTESKRKATPSFDLPDWLDKEKWALWMKTRPGKKMIPEQMQAQVEKLSQWREQGLDYAKALADAADSGWKGLFEPKCNRNGSSKGLPPEAWNDMTHFDGLDGNGQKRQEREINPIKVISHEPC